MLGFVPGVQEGLEQAGHWAFAGHSAHDDTHDEGSRSADEDECAGAMHFCHCCRVPADALVTNEIVVEVMPDHVRSDVWEVRSGVRVELLRPPLAA